MGVLGHDRLSGGSVVLAGGFGSPQNRQIMHRRLSSQPRSAPLWCTLYLSDEQRSADPTAFSDDVQTTTGAAAWELITTSALTQSPVPGSCSVAGCTSRVPSALTCSGPLRGPGTVTGVPISAPWAVL